MMKNLITILALFCIINSSQAQDETTRLKHYNLEKKVALGGYDPVTYFVNKPLKGKKQITHIYKGVIYQFISEKSKNIFIKAPEKYEPQYGGWCAYALAKEEPDLMEANPKSYKITGGKLYMFYDKWGMNMLDKWNKDEPKLSAVADKNWNKIISE
jgi:YHS domain-containing protein